MPFLFPFYLTKICAEEAYQPRINRDRVNFLAATCKQQDHIGCSRSMNWACLVLAWIFDIGMDVKHLYQYTDGIDLDVWHSCVCLRYLCGKRYYGVFRSPKKHGLYLFSAALYWLSTTKYTEGPELIGPNPRTLELISGCFIHGKNSFVEISKNVRNL